MQICIVSEGTTWDMAPIGAIKDFKGLIRCGNFP